MSIPDTTKRPTRPGRTAVAKLYAEIDAALAENQKLKAASKADLRERLALAKQRDEVQAEVKRLTERLGTAFAERDGWERTARERQSRVESLALERDLLQVERDQYKAEAKRYQISTNNLGGMLKAQGRDEEYHGIEADLPGGLMDGIPSGWLSRILLSPKTLVWLAWIGAGLAFWAGCLIGGAK